MITHGAASQWSWPVCKQKAHQAAPGMLTTPENCRVPASNSEIPPASLSDGFRTGGLGTASAGSGLALDVRALVLAVTRVGHSGPCGMASM